MLARSKQIQNEYKKNKTYNSAGVDTESRSSGKEVWLLTELLTRLCHYLYPIACAIGWQVYDLLSYLCIYIYIYIYCAKDRSLIKSFLERWLQLD